jgi:hypothetical protein
MHRRLERVEVLVDQAVGADLAAISSSLRSLAISSWRVGMSMP